MVWLLGITGMALLGISEQKAIVWGKWSASLPLSRNCENGLTH